MAQQTFTGISAELLQCIDESTRCHHICLATVGHCLELGGKHADPAHIAILLDCAEICQTSADFMLRGSDRHQLTCRICADICRAYAGRLVWDVPPAVYGGGALVLGASIWNLWLKQPGRAHLVSRDHHGRDLMAKRLIEVFAAGCPCCDEAVRQVREAACPSCDVQVWDMRSDKAAQAKAKRYGITRVPAVVINGKLADCCATGAVDLTTLRGLGLGVA